MSRDKSSVQDVLESMRAVVAYMGNRTLDEYIADPLVVDAVERRMEIMGEATKRLSMPLRDAHPEIPWRKMAGMRDMLIHGYDAIESLVVYEAVTQFIPLLIPKMESIFSTLSDPE